MGRFAIELAKSTDDEALRRLAADNPMNGRIRISLRRDPCYFHGVETQGLFNQVGVARELDSGEVIGCATRSVRTVYLNGEEGELGYVGGLRLDPRFRGGTILARAYRTFRQLHEDGRTRLYVTTIVEDNHAVREVLISRRAGLPCYHDQGRVHTLVIGTTHTKRSPGGNVRVERGGPARIEEIVGCLRRNGRRRQFFPRYSAKEFTDPNSHLRDFDVHDFHLACRGGRVAGVAATWDQSSFKQTVLAGYCRSLTVVRPFFNLVAGLCGCPRLPAPGSLLKHSFVCFVAIDDDDPDVFQALLDSMRNEAAARGHSYLLVGLHERDPLLRAARKYPHRDYASRLYVVCWGHDEEVWRSLDDRIPYLELAVL